MQRSTGPYISKPQLYGGFGDVDPAAAYPVRRAQRQRMDVVSICECLFLPWLLFCGMYALMAFYMHYTRPIMSYSLAAMIGIGILGLAGLAASRLHHKHTDGPEYHPNWCVFFFATMLIGYVCGIIFGNLNFSTCMQPYYDVINLNAYTDVNPASMLGQQLMDAGRVRFVDSAVLDLRRSMGFKNLDTYCVAPITISGSSGPLPLASYDFWAVGLGCCSPNTADFHCGMFNNPIAKQGVRFMKDDDRPFFRLAVQQAEAAYNLKANHPLFVYWTEDASAEANSFRDEGYKYFMVGMIAHFCFQLLAVTLAVLGFAKMGGY